MKIAYFVNHYPKVSHSFIRREILAVERQGVQIQRIALRGWDGDLPDEEDRSERARTRYVLRDGAVALVAPLVRALLGAPGRFFAALALAARMARDSDRPLAYHLVYLAEASRMLPWLREFGAEHVHAHFGTNSTEVAMLVRVLGGPSYSFTVHGPDEFMRPMALDEKVRRARFAVAISSFGRSQIWMRTDYRDWPKIHVVHCGLEPSFFADGAVDTVSRERFVCVGRLTEAKGQLLLVRAWAILSSRGRRAELVLAGDGPMRQQVEDLIAELRLGASVRITGWISSQRVREEILAARALVLPSFAEGLPVVIMEAMALRRPVLSTYVAGIPELVRPGENGWLFPAGSLEELVQAIEECLDASPEQLQRYGEAGYVRALERHAIDVQAQELTSLFRVRDDGTVP